MLDYNSTSRAADAVNAAIDAALQSANAATPPRDYLVVREERAFSA